MKKILGGKNGACPHCGNTMVYVNIPRIGTTSQCLACGCLREGRVKDVVRIYSYNPLKDTGNCKIKSNKSQELGKHLELDFGRGKKFSYKIIANNVVTVYKKGVIFYITKNQLEEYFEIV